MSIPEKKSELEEIEKEIKEARKKIEVEGSRTLAEIAADFGVSPERVESIENKEACASAGSRWLRG